MSKPIIPRSEFLAALQQQPAAQAQLWLRRWQFSDGGALLAERSGNFRFPLLRWLPDFVHEFAAADRSETGSYGPAQDSR